MKEYWINSWEEIHKILFSNSWDEAIERYRSPYAFRGLSSKDYKLKTSLIIIFLMVVFMVFLQLF